MVFSNPKAKAGRFNYERCRLIPGPGLGINLDPTRFLSGIKGRRLNHGCEGHHTDKRVTSWLSKSYTSP